LGGPKRGAKWERGWGDGGKGLAKERRKEKKWGDIKNERKGRTWVLRAHTTTLRKKKR